MIYPISFTLDNIETNFELNIEYRELAEKIGIKDYQDPSINPLLSADKDAKDIAKLFKKQEGVFYKKVNVKLLTDREATTYNIVNGLKWLKENVTKNDIAMIFIAGHGANDEKNN